MSDIAKALREQPYTFAESECSDGHKVTLVMLGIQRIAKTGNAESDRIYLQREAACYQIYCANVGREDHTCERSAWIGVEHLYEVGRSSPLWSACEALLPRTADERGLL